MLRKDFFERTIEELGQVLRKAMELYLQRRTQPARETLNEATVAFFDMQTQAARGLPEEALYARMAADGPDKREYYRQLADLLVLDGDLLAEEGDWPEAGKAWHQALRILMWQQAQTDTVFSFDRRHRIRELQARLKQLDAAAE
jgi:predicted negative regulator of RcsB-dependent stress response